MSDSIRRTRVHRPEAEELVATEDDLVVEEPCEIRLNGESVAVVMRTPGHDRELAAGFLYTEGIVEPGDIATISACTDPDALNPENIVEVRLAPGRAPRTGWQRNFYAASSCGVCGKASIEAIHVRADAVEDDSVWSRDQFASAVKTLRQHQAVFDATGGLHGVALFDGEGRLVVAREDVGRHNAVDKVIGYALLRELLPLSAHLLAVSGRSSFEIVQKALVARIPAIASVSAASSLAVELARDSGMTLVGFVRGDRFVVYAGPDRVR
jgi:FdhD protein